MFKRGYRGLKGSGTTPAFILPSEFRQLGGYAHKPPLYIFIFLTVLLTPAVARSNKQRVSAHVACHYYYPTQLIAFPVRLTSRYFSHQRVNQR